MKCRRQRTPGKGKQNSSQEKAKLEKGTGEDLRKQGRGDKAGVGGGHTEGNLGFNLKAVGI